MILTSKPKTYAEAVDSAIDIEEGLRSLRTRRQQAASGGRPAIQGAQSSQSSQSAYQPQQQQHSGRQRFRPRGQQFKKKSGSGSSGSGSSSSSGSRTEFCGFCGGKNPSTQCVDRSDQIVDRSYDEVTLIGMNRMFIRWTGPAPATRLAPPCAAASCRDRTCSDQLDEEFPSVLNSSVLLVQADEGVLNLVVDLIGGSTAAYSLKCRFPRETGRSQAPRRQQAGRGYNPAGGALGGG
ncbi:inorganic pyrophosphatase fused with fructose-1,6-bisphosphatase [Dorcoceras hygrometricum]|uniref:Inorganic pyrophosphatase fused with fructose-1,6-bisphosphatase n=1 Tax=Dorcoceras hygrometricum TaxID=472368 RepID=A0A2Z7B5L0_9LAMI|nr:inorganic pyrophosphatase fused with fructose-1,6-bisphosphatase [Dorcoceras hygrometricum]